MLSVYAPKKKIVVRYLQNEKGELCRVYFAVAEINGQIFVKPIKAEIVESPWSESTKPCALPSGYKKVAIEIEKEILATSSPYVSKNLSFLTIQKTRAPSTIA